MKAGLPMLFGAAAAATASLTGASAQGLLLNLTGQFECVRLCLAAPPAFTYVLQDTEGHLSLVNEAGLPSRGWIDRPGRLWAEGWKVGAYYSLDGMIIQFDNGTVWQRARF